MIRAYEKPLKFGQIIATSHEFSPLKVAIKKGNPLV